MSLTGVDPFDPLPADRREFIFAAGLNSTSGKSRDVLLYGNKTSAGSETTNTITTPLLGDDDAIARMGRRSELYNGYRKAVSVDPNATYYFVAVPEGGGATAAAVTFTFAGTVPSDATTLEISLIGEKVFVSVAKSTAFADIAIAASAAINAASEGSWPCTSTASGDTSPVVAANLGPRGDLLLGSTSSKGMRMRFLTNVGTTVTKGALTAGATDDDFTAALAEAASGEYYYQTSPKHATATVTSTDNGMGEHIEFVRLQASPSYGKTQVALFGLVGTQAQATAVAISAAANSVYARFFHQENSDWTPMMLASHHGAVIRSQEILHPAANCNGYASSDNTTYQVPPYYLKADIPSDAELRADINSGVSPVGQKRGRPSLVRHVTSRSLNAQGNNDYRAREGHLTSVVEFAWQTILARWTSQRQPFVDDDPPANGKPKARTSTPSQLRAIIDTVIDDLTSDKPLGIYDGPLLAPSKAAQMKKTKVVTKAGPGKLSASVEMFAVEHLIGSETTIRETSPAY
jgi:phage tail sheath gpL-like